MTEMERIKKQEKLQQEYDRLWTKYIEACQKMDAHTTHTNGFTKHNHRLSLRKRTEKLIAFCESNSIECPIKEYRR